MNVKEAFVFRIFRFFILKYKDLENEYKLANMNRKWRLMNRHNGTSLAMKCDMERIQVGNYTYGPLNVHNSGGKDACG